MSHHLGWKNHLPFAVFTSLFDSSFILLRLWANKIEHSWPCIFSSAHLLRQHFCAVRFSAGWEVIGQVLSLHQCLDWNLLFLCSCEVQIPFLTCTQGVPQMRAFKTLMFQMCLSLLYLSISLLYFTAHLARIFHPHSCETSFPNRHMHHLCK